MDSMTERETENATVFPLRTIPRMPNPSVSRTALGVDRVSSVMVRLVACTQIVLIEPALTANFIPACRLPVGVGSCRVLRPWRQDQQGTHQDPHEMVRLEARVIRNGLFTCRGAAAGDDFGERHVSGEPPHLPQAVSWPIGLKQSSAFSSVQRVMAKITSTAPCWQAIHVRVH